MQRMYSAEPAATLLAAMVAVLGTSRESCARVARHPDDRFPEPRRRPFSRRGSSEASLWPRAVDPLRVPPPKGQLRHWDRPALPPPSKRIQEGLVPPASAPQA